MFAWIVSFVIFSVIAFLGMGLAWILRLRSSVWLLLGATAAGLLVGGFLAQAGSAMATSVHPRDAFMKGALMGMLMSALSGCVFLGLIKFFRSRKPNS